MIVNRIFSIATIFILMIVVTNCASTSKATSDKSDEAKSFSAPSDRGTVYIYRTGRMVGAAGQLQIKVNGMEAGGTGPGTFFKWDLKPGTYTFSSFTGESSAVVQVDVKAGEVYFLRQDARMGIDSGRVTLVEVDSKKGQTEVQNCKLLVSAYVPE